MYVEDCFNVKIGGGVGLATGSKGQSNPYTMCNVHNVYIHNTIEILLHNYSNKC